MSLALKSTCWAAKWQLKTEGRTFSNSVTVYLDVPSKLPHGKSSAVQPETMAIFLGGEPVLKKAVEILGRDPDAIIGDIEMNEAVTICHPQDQFSVGSV